MRLFFFIIHLCFFVFAKKHKHKHHLRNDTLPVINTYLDLRGTVRKQFALEAAFAVQGRNMICSPLSVLIPLGKLILGANRKSEEELLAAIGLTSHRQVKFEFERIITNMEYLPGVTLDVASKIYVSTEKSVNEHFLTKSREIFKSSCQKISASESVKTARMINEWVASKTRDKINHLISPSDIANITSVILVNAIYFAGNWKEKFGEAYTDDFHSPTGIRRIPMMTNNGRYKYWQCDTLNAQIIEIPYEGDQCAMIIVLPYGDSGLPVLLRALKLAPELLNAALERLSPTQVLLSMPKFKIETEFNLNSLYQKMGLRTIFDPKESDLSSIIEDETVHISKSVHKAIIEVNEKGTEAAAATGVISAVSGSFNTPIFNANRPFLFYIVFKKEQMFGGIFSGYKSYTESLSITGVVIQKEILPESELMYVNHPFFYFIKANREIMFAGVING